MPPSTPIRLVVADLAGTTIDFGSTAPADVFVEVFARHGVTITTTEARGPMGTAKRDHIAALAAMPRVAAAWEAAHARPFAESDLDRLYAEFLPRQLESLPRYDDLIPGTREAAAALRSRDIAVAVTTGYDAAMTAVVLDAARRQGFVPDAAVCATEVAAGRPAPWMIFHAMEKTGVWPPAAVVAVGDTLADIEAARNAGVWAVGVTATGNMLGLTKAEHDALDPARRADLLAAATERMQRAGAHAVIDAISRLPAVLATLEGSP